MTVGTCTVAEYLVDRLAQIGVHHVFAVPGDYCSPFLDALDAAAAVARVGTEGELGAGYAADGYARYNGVGACCVQWGVGTFSALNCVAGSYVERLPVVVISASPTRANRRQERTRGVLFHHSTGDLGADKKVFDNVTVASVIVRSEATAPRVIDEALQAMLTHRRPAYIEVLQDVWTKPCARPEGALAPVPLRSDPEALEAMLDVTMVRLGHARAPVILAGVMIQRFGLQDRLQALIDVTGIPFASTSLGKTVLDEAQPLFAGTYAGPASPKSTDERVSVADCVLALGALITDDYLDLIDNQYAEMVLVTDEAARVGFEHFQGVRLGDFIDGLRCRVADDPVFPHTVLTTGQGEDAPPLPPETPMTYTTFYQELSDRLRQADQLGEVSLVFGESTSLYVWGNLFGLPRDGFVANAAWGSLGHETGAALGTWLASGRRPYVVAGDGGFRMVCQELASMAAQRCPAVVFVMRNDAYAIEQAFVDINAFTECAEFAPFDVLPSLNYRALAEAFRAEPFRVATVGELRRVMEEVERLTDRPALVEVVIPQKDLAPQLQRLADPTGTLLKPCPPNEG
ncbi:MAG: indolepyruvate decarboxylase [Myxococcota bacterium]|jgi:indolepyruvate decarboxylase